MRYQGESPKPSKVTVNVQIKESIYILPPWQEMPAFARERLRRSFQNHPDDHIPHRVHGSVVCVVLPNL
jgi:hypothetical protein